MRARRYKHEDYDMILSWLDARQRGRYKRSHLPKRGWVVDDVACMFLLKPDCKVGIVDYFVTNPKVSEEVRLKACDLLFFETEKEAKKIGLEDIVGSTNIPKVSALCLRWGMKFDPEPFNFFHKNLGEYKDERRNLGGIDGSQCVDDHTVTSG